MSQNDQGGHQSPALVRNTRDSNKIWPAAKDYYGLFGRAMLEVQKNIVLMSSQIYSYTVCHLL